MKSLYGTFGPSSLPFVCVCLVIDAKENPMSDIHRGIRRIFLHQCLFYVQNNLVLQIENCNNSDVNMPTMFMNRGLV